MYTNGLSVICLAFFRGQMTAAAPSVMAAVKGQWRHDHSTAHDPSMVTGV
jgi:hypothetical protein